MTRGLFELHNMVNPQDDNNPIGMFALEMMMATQAAIASISAGIERMPKELVEIIIPFLNFDDFIG